ncbi:plasmid segregation protein ParR [Staphylococcus equorum]|uniref:Plasmid segregation protein ParR n=1 Tax=Staphylococcus equorum TaxID=246432 RepID=A0A9X4LIC1_9STAP|nr:plasmid segregation protein ParR [Staphylococcus equorum]MDG0844404.1 plasmid segregation protein ParR [Staphylococcus equorum]MDG0860603.1 plasmid segregation protein ParR [Staphylococcus equorum]
MSKQETNHLLKIKKKDYPQIFEFLEGVPKGTKTAHIREALLRYIEELGTPPIPSNINKKNTFAESSDFKPVKKRYQEQMKQEDIKRREEIQTAIKQEGLKQHRTKKEEQDEMVDININQI